MRITHTFDGKVFCFCGHDGKEKKMVCRGYEKDRKAIKYVCPAKSIRGQKKMTFRVTLAYILMIAFALAMYKAKEEDKIRSFLSATG